MGRAAKQRILVPAFNVAYLPMVEPIIGTLAELDTFGLVEVARPDVEKFGAESFAAVAAEYKRLANRNVTRLHLDHVPVIDEDGQKVDWQTIIAEALELGYDSVMLDGSRLPLEENIAATAQAAKMARDAAVALEAELGAVLGHEAGPLPPYEELFASGRGFTDPDEAARFVRETGCDWLSVAIGNIHGAISGAAAAEQKVQARLNIEHLEHLREATGGVPLVLHGGSGIQLDYLRRAVECGIAKINVGTEIRQAYDEAGLALGDEVKQGQLAVAHVIRRLVTDYGIAGSADQLAVL
jgi:ketose-bisphosphate aldolase